MKQTESGLRLQVREKETRGQKKLAQYIAEKMKLEIHEVTPMLNSTIAIHHLELTTTELEIKKAIGRG